MVKPSHSDIGESPSFPISKIWHCFENIHHDTIMTRVVYITLYYFSITFNVFRDCVGKLCIHIILSRPAHWLLDIWRSTILTLHQMNTHFYLNSSKRLLTTFELLVQVPHFKQCSCPVFLIIDLVLVYCFCALICS